jgi:hypothetical protein
MRFSLFVLAFAFASLASHATTWIHASSQHFEVLSCASKRRTAELVETMELARSAFFSAFYGRPDYEARALVILCDTSKAFDALRPTRFGKLREVTGVYMGTAELPTIIVRSDLDDEQADRTLFHEFGHLLVGSVMPEPPLWFTEGLAGNLETISLQKDSFILGQPNRQTARSLSLTHRMPLTKLFSMTYGQFANASLDEASTFYAESWAFVHYCVFGEPKKYQAGLLAFAQALPLPTGEDTAAKFKRAFRTSPAEMEAELKTYLSGSFTYNPLKGALDRSIDTTTRFDPYSEVEMDFALDTARLFADRIPLNSEAYAEFTRKARACVAAKNGYLASRGALMAALVKDVDLAHELASAALELNYQDPSLHAIESQEMLNSIHADLSYRMPEDLAGSLRSLVDKGLALSPHAPRLLESLARIEAFAPEVRMAKFNMLQQEVYRLKDRTKVMTSLAIVRWKKGDAKTAVQILDAYPPTEPGEIELVRELREKIASGARR